MIRYMPKDKVGERTALCVPTQLFNVKHPYGKDKLWDPTAANKAIDELTGKYGDEYTLRVEFKRSAYDPVFVSINKKIKQKMIIIYKLVDWNFIWFCVVGMS